MFWVATGDAGKAEVVRELGARGVRVVSCRLEDLGLQAVAPLALGGVVAVVDDDRAATTALAHGVDEVVRTSELDVGALERAIARATTRSGRRRALLPSRSPSAPPDAGACALLLDALAVELVEALSAPLVQQEMLEAGVRALVEDARGTTPTEDIRDMLADVAGGLYRARELLEAVRALAWCDAPEHADAARVTAGVARLFQARWAPYATVQVEVDGRAPLARCRHADLVATLVELVGSVLESARRQPSRGAYPTLVLRCFPAEGALVLEIESADVGETKQAPDVTTLTRRTRELGGELFVDVGLGVSIVRLVLPPAEDVALVETGEAPRGRRAASDAN